MSKVGLYFVVNIATKILYKSCVHFSWNKTAARDYNVKKQEENINKKKKKKEKVEMKKDLNCC